MDAYLDNNATAPLLPAVLEAMRPHLTDAFGNASALHARGRAARAAIEAARAEVATLLGATPGEVVFNSGGSEGDTTALLGVVQPGQHVVTTQIEHHAVLSSCRRLEKSGCAVTYVEVDGRGQVAPDAVRRAIRPETRLVSVMAANNETGVIQPVEEIGRVAAEHGVLFHTDAVQAAGKVPLDVRRIGCQLLTLSAHKLHGPPGVGALYVRRGTFVRSLVLGGGQEGGRRAGTENLPGIVGLGAAARLAAAWLSAGEAEGLRRLRDRLERAVLERISGVTVNGAEAPRVPNTSSLVIPGLAARALALALDLDGIAVSTGSACGAASGEPPYVLRAMGLTPERASATIRCSLGKQTTEAEVEHFLGCLPDAVARLRTLSPGWNPSRPPT